MIEVVKHIICYSNKDLIENILQTSKIIEDQGLRVEIQYATLGTAFSALIIGRRDESKDNKAIRTVAKSNNGSEQAKKRAK